MYYQHHLFFCVNLKDNGKKCCHEAHARDYAEYAKTRLQALALWGEGKIRVSTSGCLGRCALGPTLVIYPEAVWYTYHSFEDIDEIIDQHLLQAQRVERLLMCNPP